MTNDDTNEMTVPARSNSRKTMTRRIRKRLAARQTIRARKLFFAFTIMLFLCFYSPAYHRKTPVAVAQESSGTSFLKLRRKKRSSQEEDRKQQSPPPAKPNKKSVMTLDRILMNAGKKGLGGGISGAVAGIIQVLTLMWLKTIVNYQYRYGTTFHQALVTLHKEGGLPRFYRGLAFAIVQAPLARFVSTFSNDGVEALLANLSATAEWGPTRTTFIASFVVGFWRIVLMPIDTCKTVLQVDSSEGFRNLMRKVKAGKISVLYQGAIATSVAAILGHYPWFTTYNILSKSDWVDTLFPTQLLKNAGIGFLASIVSDTFVNAIRVVKTTKQAMGSKHQVGYLETVQMILAADGWKGLFGRGLRTRILTNAIQSILFTVVWRAIADHWHQQRQGGGEGQQEESQSSSNEETNPTFVSNIRNTNRENT